MREPDAELALEGGLSVPVWQDLVEEPRAGILLAHGAGSDVDHELLESLAQAFCAARLSVLRFRYPYRARMAREGRRRPPDRAPVLQKSHALALGHLAELLPEAPLFLAGKSLGARMGAILAGQGLPLVESRVRGLLHLPFPLHPAKKKGLERAEFFRSLPFPALFVVGDRDRLCDLALLKLALARHGGPVRCHLIEGGDHDLCPPRRHGKSLQEVRAEIARACVEFLEDFCGLQPL